MEDLETLHLLANIVPEYCHALDEKEIVKNSFDIIFAFDEAIAMGYKERVNVSQIKHFTAMESNDEIRYKADLKVCYSSFHPSLSGQNETSSNRS